MCSGVAETFILGPYIFEDVARGGMQTFSIKGDQYKAMLRNYIIPELKQRNVINDIIWMQNGAPQHTVLSVRQVLQQHFDDRIIERNFAVSWPPLSPDFTPLDFWLWSYLKSEVYARNLSELKVAIKREILQIHPAMICSSLLKTISRMQSVVVCESQ